jgi:hypothetical protein
VDIRDEKVVFICKRGRRFRESRGQAAKYDPTLTQEPEFLNVLSFITPLDGRDVQIGVKGNKKIGRLIFNFFDPNAFHSTLRGKDVRCLLI